MALGERHDSLICDGHPCSADDLITRDGGTWRQGGIQHIDAGEGHRFGCIEAHWGEDGHFARLGVGLGLHAIGHVFRDIGVEGPSGDDVTDDFLVIYLDGLGSAVDCLEVPSGDGDVDLLYVCLLILLEVGFVYRTVSAYVPAGDVDADGVLGGVLDDCNSGADGG